MNSDPVFVMVKRGLKLLVLQTIITDITLIERSVF